MIVAVDGPHWICAQWFASKENTEIYFGRRLDAIEAKWGKMLSHKIVAFDSPRSFRKELNPDYKAGREQKPPDFYECLNECKEMTFNKGWSLIEKDGFEADDVLASVAKQGSQAGYKVVLCTADKDTIQCLRDGVVTQLRKLSMVFGEAEMEWLPASAVPAKYDGVTVEQFLDYQTIVGDSGDNVKGIEGIGPKTAAMLLKERGSLEALFKNPWVAGLGEKLRNRLVAYQGSACEMTRQLVTLRTDLDLSDVIEFNKQKAVT